MAKFIESSFKAGHNLSSQEKGAYKNLGAANADTVDVKTECRRQLYDTFMHTKLSEEAKEEFITNNKFQLKSIVEKHLYRGSCSFNKA